MPFAPLGRGYLTDTLTPSGFETGDFRATNPRFSAEAFAQNQAITDTVARIAASHHASAAQVALAWLLSVGEHIIPIPGTRRSAHLRDNLAATKLALTAEELKELTDLPAPMGSRY